MQARLTQVVSDAFDRGQVQDLLEESALARESMDTTRVHRIREDMERAEVRRLQPHYVEAFFLEAFKLLGGRVVEREPRRYHVSHVPALIRQRDRLIGLGEPVLQRYERITFEKSLAAVPGKPPAAFVCPGHGLLDATTDLVLERHRDLLRQPIVLVPNLLLRLSGDNTDPRFDHRVTPYFIATWAEDPDATSFTILYRPLDAFGAESWSYLIFTRPIWEQRTFSSTDIEIDKDTAKKRWSYSVPGLSSTKVYAVYFSYIASGISHFSATEMYVWPSSRAIVNKEYFAGFGLIDRLGQYREYEYQICRDTFPSLLRNSWLSMVINALATWQLATDGSITMTYDPQNCTTYPAIFAIIYEKVEAIRAQAFLEGRPIPSPSQTSAMVQGFLSGPSSRLTNLVDKAKTANEILWIDDANGTLRTLKDVALFPDIAGQFMIGSCAFEPANAACAVSRSLGTETISDIFLRAVAFEGVNPRSPRVAFNTCDDNDPNSDKCSELSFTKEVMHSASMERHTPKRATLL